VIAVDTNILVYAHRRDNEWHEAALYLMKSLSEGQARWAIPWPCIHEFLAIVTHPRIYNPPTPFRTALDSIAVWLESPNCTAIAEGTSYFELLRRLISEGRIVGGLIHDARVAAICLHHGVSVLWSSDRDFSRFPELSTINPLISQTHP
jgi:toxin-antitoxin system PIN domain toxin